MEKFCLMQVHWKCYSYVLLLCTVTVQRKFSMCPTNYYVKRNYIKNNKKKEKVMELINYW